MAKTYEIRWITRVENVDSFAQAAKEAWADLIQTMMDGKGATVIVVDAIEGEGDAERHGAGVAFDMEKPWEPEVVAVNKIDKDNPEVFSERDKAEAMLYQKMYEKLEQARKDVRGKFTTMFDEGLVN